MALSDKIPEILVSLTRQEMDRSKRQVGFCHSISLAFKLQEPRSQLCAGGNTWKRVHAFDDFKSYFAILKLVSSSSLEIDYRIREWIIADIIEKTREILPVGVTLSRSNKRIDGCGQKTGAISDKATQLHMFEQFKEIFVSILVQV
ncbi:hypothetical protein H0E87_005460 [Populus deltoides]|uniref:Uncharacterized protein n=1 Tax=Populus deltoides TaxID=3696 RepID=A0A8T2ZJN4_POPDE|nr:hypothetical protein H0E87_005460 [Populus deltoides]